VTADDEGLTPADIASLNRAAVERTATIARLAGTALVIIGAVGAVAWVWVALRTQDRASSLDLTFGGEAMSKDLPLADRIDLFTGSLGLLLTASTVMGIGLFARLAVPGQDVGDWSLTNVKTPGAVEIAVFTTRRSSWVTVTLV
jgi:hypothetical protein